MIKELYEYSEYHSLFYESDSSYSHSRGQYRALSILEESLPRGSTLLDYGCGSGRFIRFASSRGYICEGVEYSKANAQMASKNSSCKVYTYDEVEDADKKYDCIYMSDVLEHLHDPRGLLLALDKLLLPGGTLFIEGPLENNQSLVYLTLYLVSLYRCIFRAELPAGSGKPYHLFRAKYSNQVKFLASCLPGYTVMHEEVFETGWPFVGRRRVFRVVSTIAIGLSHVLPKRLHIGNRIIVVMKKSSQISGRDQQCHVLKERQS